MSDLVSQRPTTRGFTVLRGGVEQIAAAAGVAERRGFDAAWSPEFYTRSAVVTLARMAGTTSHARIGSSIAYAVGRSPVGGLRIEKPGSVPGFP